MPITSFEAADWLTDVLTEGEGRPLVYLHGFDVPPQDAPFLQSLAANHRVLAPRLPGFTGASEADDSIHNIQDLALHVREFVTRTAGESVDLMGHSLGGMVAAEVAAVSPGIVRRLILVDSYGLWDSENPLPDPYMLSGSYFREAIGHHEPEVTDPWADKIWRATDVGASTKYLWPVPDRGLDRRIRFVTCPTLVVHGAQDPLIPISYARRMVSLLSDSALEIVPEAGHAPMVDQCTHFTEVVNAFLTDTTEAQNGLRQVADHV